LLGAPYASGPAWGQPPTPPAQTQPAPEVEAPAAPAPAAPAAPATPDLDEAPESDRGVVPEEALERIDRALEEVEERIEAGAEEIEDDADSAVLRERRRRVREIREQVHRRMRNVDRSDNKVAFGSSIHVEEGDVARDVVAIGGRIRVDGDVEGDVVAVGGPVSIDGRVTGDVVAVGAGVELGEDAEVLGEVTSVGGRVERADGAEVVGPINEVAFGAFDPGRIFRDRPGRGWDWDEHSGISMFDFGWFGFVLSLTILVVLVLLTCLVRLVAGSTVERVRATAVESPWRCGLVGLAIELFFLPVMLVVLVILAISIIGIPLILLLPFVVLAFVLALVVGFTAVAQAVGEWAGRRFDRQAASPFVAIVLGVLLLQAVHVVAEFFDSFDGFLWFFAVMFGLVGFLIRYVAWTVGIGAVFLTAVRRSSFGAAAPLPPLPPPSGPLPEAPPYPRPPVPPEPAGEPGWSAQPTGDRSE
jgi:hypothetical protein